MSQLGKSALWMGAMAAVAVGLGLFAWLGVKEPEERAEKKKAAEERLVSLGGTDAAAEELEFTRVVLESRGERTTVERQPDGKWRIVAPVKAAVDPFQMDQVVSQLTTGKIKTVVDEAPKEEDLKRYGLAPPAFVVRATARTKEGGEARELVLKGGGENPFDGSVYLQRDDDPRVFAVQGGVRWALDKSTYDLRHKDVLEVEKDVRAIEVKAPTFSYTLEREGEEKDVRWRITRPSPLAAEKQAVEQLLLSLRGHRAVRFLEDSPEARSRAGLDRPRATAEVTPAKGAPIRLQLSEVKEEEKARTYLLRTQGDDTVLAEVEPGAITALDKDPFALRDRSVLTFDRAKVARLVFKKPGARDIVVERVPGEGSNEEWRVLEPEQGPGKKFKLSSILWSLGALKASALLDENPKSWAKWGLDEPEREVVLLDAKGQPVATLAVGAEVPGKESTRYARGSRPQAVEMEAGRLADLPQSVDDVLDRPAPKEAAPPAPAAAPKAATEG